MGQQRSGVKPDVVMACCGDVPTLETLAAVDALFTTDKPMIFAFHESDNV